MWLRQPWGSSPYMLSLVGNRRGRDSRKGMSKSLWWGINKCHTGTVVPATLKPALDRDITVILEKCPRQNKPPWGGVV